LAVLVCAATFLAALAGCGNDAKSGAPGATSNSVSGTQSQPPSKPSGTQSELPLKLDGDAAALAVTDQGLYVADSGSYDVDVGGFQVRNGAPFKDGQILLLAPGASAQKQVAQVNLPVSVAVAPDGTSFVVDKSKEKIEQFSAGATTPTILPFQFGHGHFDGPWRVALTPTGDVVVLTETEIQILPKGASAPRTIMVSNPGRELLAVDPKGAIYFEHGYNVMVIDNGSNVPRIFEKTSGKRSVVSMAFDTNGDRYAIYATCNPDPKGKCVYAFTVSKFANNSTTPTDIPIPGLTSALSVAVNKSAIYVADARRVVEIIK
jgi:hypothetical protein